jgi:hypothetical protein
MRLVEEARRNRLSARHGARFTSRPGITLQGEEKWTDLDHVRQPLAARRCSSPNLRRSSTVFTIILTMSSSPVDPWNAMVDDIVGKAWEFQRLRRVKTNVINAALRPGLEQLLQSLMPQTDSEMDLLQWLREKHRLAGEWFGDETKNRFWRYSHGSSSMNLRSKRRPFNMQPDISKKIDRLIASREARLSKALCLLAALRGGLGRQLHAKVERIIDGKVLALDNASKKSRPSAA